MAITAKIYGLFIKNALDISSDEIKVMLCTSAYVPNQDTQFDVTSVTNEVAGAGYIAGGATLTNVTVTYDVATNVIKFDADDVVWSNSTITARYAVIYDATISALLGYVDFGEDKVSSNGNFAITWDTAGIFTVTVA